MNERLEWDILEQKINRFKGYYVPFWYLDIQTAIQTAHEVWIDEGELFDLCEEYASSLWYNINEAEPNDVIRNHIVLTISDLIYDKTQKYIEIPYYNNYMDSWLNLDNGTKDELEEIKKEYPEEWEELSENDYIKILLDYL